MVKKRMVEVYALKIDEYIEDTEYQTLLSYVTEKKRNKIEKFHFMEDAKRTLYGDILIRYLVCQKFQVKNSVLTFDTNEFGKPYLNGFSNFCFNISHSGNWVVCAVSEKEIGIDIEHIKPIDLNIAKNYFADSEYLDLITKQEEKRTEFFYDLWTLKESYIKYMGKGLLIPLSSFIFKLITSEITVISKTSPSLCFRQFFLDQEYKLSVCSEENEITDNIKIISINKFFC